MKRSVPTKWLPKIIRFGALLIIALGFALRLYTLASESLWYDELLQLDIAQGTLASIFPRLRGHAGVPLDYLIAHFWILLGRSDIWVRIPAVVLGTLTLPVIYQLGRWLVGPGEGLLLMALLTFSPFHIRYSQEARPYALVLLGVTLAGYAFWRLHQTNQWRYVIPLQIGVLVFSMAHFFALTILGLLLLFTVIDFIFSQNRRQTARIFGLLLLTALLPAVLLVLLGWGHTLFYTSRGFGQALVEPEKFTVEADQKPDQGAGPQVSPTFIKQEILAPLGGGAADISLWLFNLLAGLGLLYLLVQQKYKLSLLLLLWLVLPISLIITFLIYRGTFFASRYIMMMLPAYLLLLATGILALPRWLRCAEPWWLSFLVFLLLSGFVFTDLSGDLGRLYRDKNKENWRLVGEFITKNAKPGEAIIAMRAEPIINWYYPPGWAAPNYFWDLEIIQATAAKAKRSWVILSIFSSSVDDDVETWLDELGAVSFDLDPIITVYYLGVNATPDQLLTEVRDFALPVNHKLYARLAEENQQAPAIARQYYQLAIEHAPDDQIRAEYQRARNALPPE